MTHAAKQLTPELSHDYGFVVKALGRMTKNIGDHGDNAISVSAYEQ